MTGPGAEAPPVPGGGELIDGAVADSLWRVATALALLYVLLSVGHLGIYGWERANTLVGVAAASALLCGALAIRWRAEAHRPASSHLGFAVLVGIALLNSGLHLVYEPIPRHSTNFAALLIGIGLFELDRRWWWGETGLTLATWLGLAWTAPGHPDWVHYGFVLLLATLLSFASHRVRADTLRRLGGEASSHHRVAQRFRALAEAAPDAIITIDRAGRIRFANPAVQALLGYEPAGLVGRDLTDLMPEFQRDAHRGGLRRYLETGIRTMAWQAVALDAQHRDGRTIPVEISFTEFREEGEQRFTGFLRDVRERRQAEQDRLELERRVLHAQKLESIGVLAGGIAHDFNNLLTPIVGNASVLLEENQLPPAAHDAIAEIASAAERSALLTQQLLAYAGGAVTRPEPLDLAEQAREIGSLVQRSVPRSVEFEVTVEGALPPVEADRAQVQQLLMNLLTNAGEATGTAGGRVETHLSAVELDEAAAKGLDPQPPKPGRFVRLTVSDRGPGLDRDARSRMFDPFFSTKEQGRGLGLSAVMGIVASHGGGIEVGARPGGGTEVSVFLPAARGAVRPSQAAPAEAADEPAGGTILVVDDEPAVRRVLSRLLGRLGYDVAEAADGLEGAARLRELDGVVAVFLDLNMPGPGPAQTFASLREGGEVPVVFCSGHPSETLADSLAGAPRTAFLAKPFSGAALAACLGDLLGRPG